jgi:hypothetical protein
MCRGLVCEDKKTSTTVHLGFETRTIFMSCLLSRHKAVWLLFQNFSIACFVWTRSFQSAGAHRTDVATHNTSHLTFSKRPCHSWHSQSPASHRRGPGSVPGAFIVEFMMEKKKHWYKFFSITSVLLCHLSFRHCSLSIHQSSEAWSTGT